MISVTATVVRNGEEKEIPISQLVPGDIVHLSAGDMIPADVRLISAKDLFIIQATLTGESMPVEKMEAPDTRQGVGLLERSNSCFLGTSVESGTAKAVVIVTGSHTYFGHIARNLAGEQEETSFDRGIKKFTWLMIRFLLVMVPLVFVINGLTKHNWHDAFFFSMAVAVGLTPEMLPMIVLGLPVEGRDGDVAQECHREATERDPKLRRDGCVLHGQDRHVDDGSHYPRAALQHP